MVFKEIQFMSLQAGAESHMTDRQFAAQLESTRVRDKKPVVRFLNELRTLQRQRDIEALSPNFKTRAAEISQKQSEGARNSNKRRK